jgi:putative membrane protein
MASPVRANDTLANERTYLAYVRTALAFIAFGFVIARFALFAREFSELVHRAAPAKNLSTEFGTAMAGFGILVAIMGAWRYAATNRGLERGEVVTMPAIAGYGISLFVAVVGVIVAFALVSYK